MDSTGKRIKHCREKSGYTQDEMATMMGKSSKQTISSWENDKNEPTLSDLKKLAKILNTTVAYLIGEEPVLSAASNEYVTISKDELLKLQRLALDKAVEEKEAAQMQVKRLQNDH
ncbi:helix-turn-helix domain-containing protein [Salmonirosea aquatica]|uniref:Helix-turn-helix domain-containing protein n=1 Tax=Salmonirosea aquatica TaxID=2654236 RepID=A0A7C9BMQ4_9BACT|nr:helix-turn-helix domain-containing protein [Cytophagaceae bacterium SJW1-29]